MPKNCDVFISWHSRNAPVISALRDYLSANDIHVWLGGERDETSAKKGIKNATTVIIAASEWYTESQRCREELAYWYVT